MIKIEDLSVSINDRKILDNFKSDKLSMCLDICHLQASESYMQCDFVREGCGRAVIQRDHGAVWMITSMRIIQHSNLRVGDIITYKTYPRIIDGKKYVFYLEITCH